MSELKNGTRVKYDVNISSTDRLTGNGTIVGMATTGTAILGINYIIEPDIPISNEAYDYKCFCMFEKFLTVLNPNN